MQKHLSCSDDNRRQRRLLVKAIQVLKLQTREVMLAFKGVQASFPGSESAPREVKSVAVVINATGIISLSSVTRDSQA